MRGLVMRQGQMALPGRSLGQGRWVRHTGSFGGECLGACIARRMTRCLKGCSPSPPAQDAVVRSCAVSALLGLYSQHDNLSPLHDFTERFQQRFKELIYDVDECVAVKGVSAGCLFATWGFGVGLHFGCVCVHTRVRTCAWQAGHCWSRGLARRAAARRESKKSETKK